MKNRGVFLFSFSLFFFSANYFLFSTVFGLLLRVLLTLNNSTIIYIQVGCVNWFYFIYFLEFRWHYFGFLFFIFNEHWAGLLFGLMFFFKKKNGM